MHVGKKVGNKGKKVGKLFGTGLLYFKSYKTI